MYIKINLDDALIAGLDSCGSIMVHNYFESIVLSHYIPISINRVDGGITAIGCIAYFPTVIKLK